MQEDQRDVNHRRGRQCLEKADNHGLLSDFAQVTHTELVANGKSNEAKRHFADDVK